MQPEAPAIGISRNPSYNGEDSFHVECECTCPDHALSMYIEVNRENEDSAFFNEVTVTLFATLRTLNDNGGSTFLDDWKLRLKYIWQLLRKGEVSIQSTILLRDQAALNLAEVLRTTVEKHQAKLAEKNK